MLLFTVFITLVISIISYVCYVIYYQKYKDIEKIPGPPVKPLVGNILEFGNNIVDTFENTVRIIRTYGPLVRIWKGPFRLNLILTDPDQVEVFLSSNVHLKKSADYDGFIPWLGQGLINSNGDTWRKHRKIVTPAFHFKILEQFSDTFHHFSKILIELLKKENGKNVDVYKYITMYAMDVICESSMRVNAQIQENWDKTYINATKDYMEIYIKRFFNFFKHYDFLFNLTSEYKIRQKYVDTLHSFTRGVIQRRKKEREVAIGEETTDDFGIKKKKIFLDILLDSNELTDEEIREEVDSFIFAGHDTVSSAMSFGLFEIAQDRDIQNNILEEIESVVGSDKNEKITLQHLNNMNYLDRVMKEVLRKYPAGPFIERELTEDVILGDTWRKQRKLLTPAFHFKILEQFSDTFHHFSRILIELLKKENGKNVDIYKYITMYAMDVICESSMRVNAQIQENWDKTYINATKGYMEIHIKRFFNILSHYDFLFNLTREYKIRQNYVDTLHSFTRGVIQRRKKKRKVAVGEETTNDFGIKKKKAFLDILLDSNELTDEEIREEVDTFIFAGHDTVSSAISFGLFEIAQDRDIQNNILEEIESVVGPDKNEKITLQHLNNMNYLDRVMKEVLRKYPAVPFIERELTEDVILDGLNIPKSTTLTFHIYAQHHDEKLFPNPEHFDPDRFLPENKLKRHPFAYIPFSGGPRNCIGQRYAMMNCKTTIANILRNFEISSTEPVHVPILGNDVVMKSINGLCIHLKIRK